MNNLQPVRGTKDYLFEDQERFSMIVDIARNLSRLYGFSESSTPIFEFTDVFKRTLGDFSDIVNKEMYSFNDRKGQSITLRPEFTASVMRSIISNGLYNKLPLKLFTYGPLFRYERPQKGRMRQFHQLNFEYIGNSRSDADVEVISLAVKLLEELGILDDVSLEINTLGDKESRSKYIEALVEYFNKYKNDLSEDSKLRLDRNPLRILDSKDAGDKHINSEAPMIHSYLSKDAEEFYASVKHGLNILGIKYKENHMMVRGLDYYNHTAFEFVSENLGAQGTVLAGGRYDGLLAMMGGKDYPGVGFAAGIERLIELANISLTKNPLITVVYSDEIKREKALKISENLRANNLAVNMDYHANESKALKKAIDKGSSFVVFVNDKADENSCVLKNLLDRSETEVACEILAKDIKSKL